MIQHVVPLNDIREHLIETDIQAGPACYCSCGVRFEPREGGCGFIVVHASFDGREGVERALEVFGLPLSDEHPQWGIFNEE